MEAALTNPNPTYLADWTPVPGLNMGHQYRHAPITQAILEFRVSPHDESPALLDQLNLGDEYSGPEPVYGVDRLNESEAQGGDAGFSYTSRSGQRVVHVRPHAFTYRQLGSYAHWGEFLAQAEAAWLVYRQAAAPLSVVAMGVRFINHIPMPERQIEIKDYLRMSVDIPPQLPQTVSNLFLQVDIPLPAQNALATITSSIVDGNEDHPGGWMLLDIDTKAGVGISTSEDSFDETVRTTLDRLRLAKNYVFEACITDATRGLMD